MYQSELALRYILLQYMNGFIAKFYFYKYLPVILNSPAAKANFLANPVSPDKVFFLRIIYLLDVYDKIQEGVDLLPLGKSRNSRWRPI